jgi:hypothetical protein
MITFRSRGRRCLVLVSLLTACAADDSLPSIDVRAEPLRGELTVASVSVPEGTTLAYDSDLVIDCQGDIVIAGTLMGLARPARESASCPDGADLTLKSATQIVISGSVIGAPGRDGRVNAETLRLLGLDAQPTSYDPKQIDEQLQAYVSQHGTDGIDLTIFDAGRGGNVHLVAPKILVNLVRAGAAGSGGPGGSGGDGGTLRTTPNCCAWQAGALGGFGGAGGHAGAAMWEIRNGLAGRAGAGGDALGGSLALEN